jgi:hypothetical protein
MKKITVFFVACMLASMNAAAEIYKCTDAEGKVHYGDKTCEGESTIFTPRASPGADEYAGERREKTRRLLRAYQEEHAEEKQKAAELKAEKEQRTKKCSHARNRYRQMTEAGRIYRIDKDGNHIDYTEEERAAAIARERAAIEKWCD